MNFNCPVVETSESIEPNDNNLELNAIAYTFFKIDSSLNFNSSFGDREFLASVSLVSPQRRTRKLKKEHFLCCGTDSTPLLWHSGTQKLVGRAKQRDQIDNKARLFWKSIVKTKHQSLDSLAFIRLVPDADRIVRHICIRCITSEFLYKQTKSDDFNTQSKLRTKYFFFASCGSLFPFTRANAQWVIHGFK